MPVMKLLLLLSVVIFPFSCACVAMKAKDFDDVMPLTRIPPTNPLWTTEAMPTTSASGETTPVNMGTTSQTMETTIQTTSTSTTSTSTTTTSTTTATTTRDPCDGCMIPVEFPLSDSSTPCGPADTTLPSIMISALPNGMNCELAVSGCVGYETITVDGDCNLDFLSPNPICQNGVFIGDALIGISKIRCNG